MKKNKNLKTAILDGMIMIALVIGMTSCNNSKTEDPKDVAEDHNDAKFDNSKNEKDAQFLVDATEINMMEIQLGQLASEKAMMGDVKEMGTMMVSEHTKVQEELKGLAAKKNVTIPTALTDDAQSEYKKFSDKSGHDFDKDYCDKMVSGHKDAIDKFEKASTDATDPDIKQWAASTLPALRKHLDYAMTCQEKCKKM